jgi:hypothetical protein
MGGRARSRTRSPKFHPATHASASDPPWSNAGALAAQAWLATRNIPRPSLSRWHVEISLDVVDAPALVDFDERVATRFHIDIYAEEWGFYCCHHARASWIRVTDVPFVHGRDDFKLLAVVPPLKEISSLVRAFELQHSVWFRRDRALVRANLANAESAIRRWVESF